MLDVYFDGMCPLCIRSVEALGVLDLSGRLRFNDLEALEAWPPLPGHPDVSLDDLRQELHVLAPDQSVHRGFFAFRRIARELPVLWPVLPLLYLPGASILGPRLYRRVAGSRVRLDGVNGRCCDRHTQV